MRAVRVRVLALVCGGVLTGCALDPEVSYPGAFTAAECQRQYEAELNQWNAEQAGLSPRDQSIQGVLEALFNGAGLHQGEELFKRRLAVCRDRVRRKQSNIVMQPGSGGDARPFACRGGGGVFQGGAALCPGH